MVALTLATGGAGAADPDPLLVTPVAADLGVVPAGSVAELEFDVANHGDEAVRLRYIHGECDCTLRVPVAGHVAAGGEFVLRATLDLDGVDAGPFEELITILTDHFRQTELWIPITAQVLASPDARTIQTAKD